MDLYQEQIIKFIRTSINGEKVQINRKKSIDWDKIINISRQNKIEALVYWAIPNEIKNIIHNDVLNLMKKEAFISGLTQQRHMKNIENLLMDFNKLHIDVLMLNDIGTRDLYLNPLYRTISEGNLFIKKDDLDKAKDILQSKGYVLYKESSFSELYIRNRCLPIRLQWGFEKDSNNEYLLKFNKDISENLNCRYIGKSYAYEMVLEDLIIFKFINMVKDIYHKGIDMRELIDITLLVNKVGGKVDWMRVMNRCKKYKIYTIVTQIMISCNELLKMEMPIEIEYILQGDKTFLDKFINDMFTEDYGTDEGIIQFVSGELAYKCEKRDVKRGNKLRKSVKFTLKKIMDMMEEYDTAK